MLWQLAYAEIYFLDKLWPDFNGDDLKKVVNNFYKIKKKFWFYLKCQKILKQEFIPL